MMRRDAFEMKITIFIGIAFILLISNVFALDVKVDAPSSFILGDIVYFNTISS
jgi:hypothetical protein